MADVPTNAVLQVRRGSFVAQAHIEAERKKAQCSALATRRYDRPMMRARNTLVAALASIIVLVTNDASAQTVRDIADRGRCDDSPVTGLSNQLIELQMCMMPGVFVSITPHANVTLNGSHIYPFMTSSARDALWRASNSSSIVINSAFRTLADQFVLYYGGGCALAASPGNSNHETGNAIDVNNYGAAFSALTGAGCTHTYPSNDPVHYDCPGADMRAASIRAFQHLWNVNNPGDQIAEDGSYGPMTEARLSGSPANGFAHGGCSTPCDNTAGPLTFSCDGPNDGLHCVSIDEPADPDSWSDNVICTQGDIGFRWSNAGPIDGMNCVQVSESAEDEAAAWADNYACLPSDAPYRLFWSSAGPIAGAACVHLDEQADPGSWQDNYLCTRPVADFSAGGFTFSGDGPNDGLFCISVDEPSDPDTWSDNNFCSDQDVGMRWSHDGPIDGMRCIQIVEPAEDEAAAWSDNYLCLPEDSEYVFTWSSAGPIAGMDCVRWYEAADLDGSWSDNYVCVGRRAPGDHDGGTLDGSAPDASSDGGVTSYDGGANARRDGADGSTVDGMPVGGCSCRVSRTPLPRQGATWIAVMVSAVWMASGRRRRRRQGNG